MSFLQKFTKRDLGFAILTGFLTGTIAWRIFEFLKIPELSSSGIYCDLGECFGSVTNGVSWSWLVLLVPVLWILGVLLGYLLGQWLEFFNQFGKFSAIGFTNAAVDFGILNILISQTGFVDGKGYSAMKSISFLVALCSSYIWNKYWAFRPDADVAQAFGNQGRRNDQRSANDNFGTGATEFGKFFIVTVVSFAINVGIATLVVNYINPIGGLNEHVWANVGAVAGSAIALVFSFVGFKMAVFR